MSSHLFLLVSGTRIQKLRRRGTQDTPEPPTNPGRFKNEVRLCTAQQVSELLQVPVTWIYTRWATGKFPHIRLRRQLRSRLAEVAACLERNSRPEHH
ncbi:helix-turn-helix domain-containing protein [Nocardioides rubriscoriae]|uniref:helix-turn-helix domain-containing protein n=1 Tax=Nocardioides rubriscoriae TaxID=642762 RepID=UPI0011E02BAF